MAYSALLLNRLAQFGRVSYDLSVIDDAGLLPPYRAAVSWLIASDSASSASALASAVATATASLHDGEIAANIVSAINQGDVTFHYSTPSENIAAVREVFRSLSGWDAVRLGNYISGLNLTNAQLTNFFGYSGSALTAFKARLASAVAAYTSVVGTQGA